jgi:hypothetical protein
MPLTDAEKTKARRATLILYTVMIVMVALPLVLYAIFGAHRK